MKDKEIKNLIKKEETRQKKTINLIASENYVSQDVLRALGSVLTNKYAEGYPQKRYYGGNKNMDKIEEICKERTLKLFKLSPQKWHVNVQSYSGSPANMAVYYGLLEPGEKIMGMSLPFGGHLTHGWKVNFSAKIYKAVQYTVGQDGLINYKEVFKIAKKEKPKVIVVGATAYSRIFDFKKFREIADSVGAYLMADISHVAGLVAASVHPSPFLYADVVTTTTHKTLRGPRGAIIICKKELAQQIDRAVFPGLQGGPHLNTIAAIGVCLEEARQPKFKKYIKQVVKNAKVFAQELKRLGWKIISGGTDTHLFLVDTMSRGISGKETGEKLEKAGIIVNKNMIPFDTRKPQDPSGIRIGTPAITTQGYKEKDIKKLAEKIDKILKK
jgi:glycine hydroxymethyltransferase